MDAFTTAELRDAGYRRHTSDGVHRSGETGFVALWQKRVTDEIGTRYFINVREWDWSKLSPVHSKPSFDAGVQFHRDGRFFNVDYLGDKEDSIDMIETLFDELWEKMDFAHVQSEMGSWNRHSEVDVAPGVVKS